MSHSKCALCHQRTQIFLMTAAEGQQRASSGCDWIACDCDIGSKQCVEMFQIFSFYLLMIVQPLDTVQQDSGDKQ